MNSKPTLGPLSGTKIVMVGGLGPGPFAAMLLADLGADVLRIDRPQERGRKGNVLARSQRSVCLDLKKAAGAAAALALFDKADALIEGFRPGVMERLGLGPDQVLERNPRLVYGRMTGWGQTGPLAHVAGHDINYIALSGALSAVGTNGQLVAPLNLVGDFGGGALYLAVGILAAVISARSSGAGQIVDCSMAEGAASLMTLFYALNAEGRWGERGSNLLDGGAHFYNPFRCADGRWIAIGAIEPQFYALLREKIGLTSTDFDVQMDKSGWPQLKAKLAEVFAERTRAQWCELLEGTETCFSPVLDLNEAPAHPHNVARGNFVDVGGTLQPRATPLFSGTPSGAPSAPSLIGADSNEALRDWGVPESVFLAVE